MPEDAHGKLRAPRAHQAADTNNLAFVHLEVHVVADFYAVKNGMIYAPVLHLKADLADSGILPFGKAVGQAAADHSGDDDILGKGIFVLVHRLDGVTVADDRYLVGDVGDLVQLMRDDD